VSSLIVLVVGALTVLAAGVTVTQKNPVYAALSMLVALGGVAALMLGLRSPFLAAMQVLLYGGAIMVLFMFVIMLLTLRQDEMGPEPPLLPRTLAALGAFGTALVLWKAIRDRGGATFEAPALGDDFGSTEHFARFLYTDYVVAFELVTVLVMAAAAGVIVLARRPGQGSLQGARLTHHGAPEPRSAARPAQEVHR
jgi:NADH-quinone oxidoreductase subunit J